MGTNLLQWTHPHSFIFLLSVSVCKRLTPPHFACQWKAWRVRSSGYVGSCLKGGMCDLWPAAVSPLQLSVAAEWAVASLSLSLDGSPSRHTVCSIAVDPLAHRQFGVDHITPGGRSRGSRMLVCQLNSGGEADGRYISAKTVQRQDRAGATSEEMYVTHAARSTAN